MHLQMSVSTEVQESISKGGKEKTMLIYNYQKLHIKVVFKDLQICIYKLTYLLHNYQFY